MPAATDQIDQTPLDVAAIRDDFPILQGKVHGKSSLIYFDNGATSQQPRMVMDAMNDVAGTYYANVHRGIHALSEMSTDRYEWARSQVRQFIGAAHDHECVFTSGTTAAINLVARSWGDANVGDGDEILLTEMEHHSNLVPWHQLAERTGCTIKAIPITNDGRLDLTTLDDLLTERTKLVAVTAVSNVLGTINPIDEIAAQAHAVGAVVLVDAAQSVPHVTTNVQASGVDFLAFSGHKMCGPSGVGVLYGRESLLEALPPFLGGGSMISTVEIDGFTPGELPAKFEAGTPPIIPAIGLGAAIDYLTDIGLDRIYQHEAALVARAHQILEVAGDVTIFGPSASDKAGIVSFIVDGIQAMDLAQLLDRHGVAIRAGHHCTMPLHQRLGVSATDRASFYLYNTVDEVERFGEALEAARKFLR